MQLSATIETLPVPAARTTFRQRFLSLLPGIAISGAIAALAIQLGRLDGLQANGMSALTVAIVAGIALGNTAYRHVAAPCSAGVGFSKQNLLRLGIVLYGFRLTFQDIAHVGMAGVVIDLLVLASTFSLAAFVGTRVFGLDRATAILIGAGSAICGAAAIMATQPVARARGEEVTVAVSTVVVFGTIAIFLYPVLYRLNLSLGILPQTRQAFGMFAGSTIHEVAQVVAAARSVGADAADTAVIAKMVRVMMLAPFLLILSALLRKRDAGSGSSGGEPACQVTIPWFAVAFVAMVAFNSVVTIPPAIIRALVDLDTALLAMAMAALGLTTQFSAIRRAGIKPLLLAALLFGWLIVGGGLINRFVPGALSGAG